MYPRILCLLWLAATLHVSEALAQDEVVPTTAPTHGAASTATTPATAAGAPGGIRISIKNEYEASLNFGPLGKGWRKGTDMAEGTLNRRGDIYEGVVTASVASDQKMSGSMSSCGPSHYEDLQDLKVIGHPVDGFNLQVQKVYFTQPTNTGTPNNASNQYLLLEFAPKTMTSQQPGLRRPEDMLPDLVVSCHTLIDTLSGIAFLPLNDSRWTMEGGGYIIILPKSGVLDYTDDTLAAGIGPTQGAFNSVSLGPFKAKKSIWTIQVKRAP